MKLLSAFVFLGLVACRTEVPTSQPPPPPAQSTPQLEATSGVCPVWAPRCCGLLRPGGICIGNCVARTAQCP